MQNAVKELSKLGLDLEVTMPETRVSLSSGQLKLQVDICLFVLG